MSLIRGIIPKQGFEIVRDQIGVILLTELTAQQKLRNDMPEDFEVLLESLIPTEASQQISINVLLAGAEYGQMTQQDSQGRTMYNIDVAASGSELSPFKRDKYIGIINYIFRSPYYRTMGLPPGKIGGVYVESFANLDPYKKEDTAYTTFGRIQLAVRIQEGTQTWEGVELLGNNCTVRLDLTNKGYKFVFNS